MRRGTVIVACTVAVFVAGCKTETEVIRVDEDQVIVRERGEGGANPEKGLDKACLPSRSIIEIRKQDKGDQESEVLVTCGPKVKR